MLSLSLFFFYCLHGSMYWLLSKHQEFCRQFVCFKYDVHFTDGKTRSQRDWERHLRLSREQCQDTHRPGCIWPQSRWMSGERCQRSGFCSSWWKVTSHCILNLIFFDKRGPKSFHIGKNYISFSVQYLLIWSLFL